MGLGSSILHEPETIRGTDRVKLELIHFVEDRIRVRFIIIVAGSGPFRDEFWYLWVGFGLTRFFERKSRILFKMKNYIFEYEWVFFHVDFSI